MTTYRTHTCGQLRGSDAGKDVKISGWVHRKRDHGGLLFIDLRDHYGLTQCVINSDNAVFAEIEKIRLENVIMIEGEVVARMAGTTNKDLPTGEIEVKVKSFELLSSPVTDMLPLQVNSDENYGEEVRLRYRFLDLRRETIHKNIMLRSDVIYSMRRRMVEQGFREFQTPILTASSPEGARDFLVPSRLHPGKFYALPQAPQQFKQLLMMSGFDRYFQIAPCFRDEDARADRTAGEFYQLDMEMSFVTQDDVFSVMEKVIGGVFEEFAEFTGLKQKVSPAPWIRIPYDESMLKYGNDKPDLRNPLVIVDVSSVFARADVEFKAFKGIVEKGGVVRAIRAPKVSDRPRSFFDKLNSWAQSEGAAGLGYVTLEGDDGKGPIAKFLPAGAMEELRKLTGAESGDAVFFAADLVADKAASLAGKARTKIAEELDIIEKDTFKFCWVIDYPMFELNDKTGKIDFSHNPFSMPQGGLKALLNEEPLKIKATQYDCVANGLELCSGGIRNHMPEAMEKAFEIAGYPKGAVQEKFGGMYNAFKLGAPPHGGCAFGIDRIIMMLAKEPNIREVIAFPMNQQAEDLMMGAPSPAEPHQLKDVSIKLDLPKAAVKEVKQAS
ncbi:MAG TPA: aspartate--tRNA ligase [Patescibacteria group bacterium]|nr:aspartate--tRNA ligase [Patescibacteria group bacterium]